MKLVHRATVDILAGAIKRLKKVTMEEKMRERLNKRTKKSNPGQCFQNGITSAPGLSS